LITQYLQNIFFLISVWGAGACSLAAPPFGAPLRTSIDLKKYISFAVNLAAACQCEPSYPADGLIYVRNKHEHLLGRHRPNDGFLTPPFLQDVAPRYWVIGARYFEAAQRYLLQLSKCPMEDPRLLRCLETSDVNQPVTTHLITQERRPHLHRCKSLESREEFLPAVRLKNSDILSHATLGSFNDSLSFTAP
jgi:hypothetical protein